MKGTKGNGAGIVQLVGLILSVIAFAFAIDGKSLGAGIMILIGIFFYIGGVSWQANPRNPMFTMITDIAFGLGIAWLAAVPLQFTILQDSYWVFMLVGFATLFLGVFGRYRIKSLEDKFS